MVGGLEEGRRNEGRVKPKSMPEPIRACTAELDCFLLMACRTCRKIEALYRWVVLLP